MAYGLALLIAPLVGTVFIGAGPAVPWLACGLTGLGAASLMIPRGPVPHIVRPSHA
jgi:hypothetical protein